MMKAYKNILILLFFLGAIPLAQAQVGYGTEKPHKSSVVDMESSKRGLLIPRFDIPNLNAAAPVTSPANSLLVYNLGTTKSEEEGFYYWNDVAKKWVAITTDSNQLTYTVSQGDGVTITTDASSGNNKDFKVGITASDTPNQYLVTYDDNGTLKTKWQSLPDILAQLQVDNGLTYDSNSHSLKLGGPLTGPTEIVTDTGKTLAITGLQTGGNSDEIVVMDTDGILKKISRTSILDPKTLTLESGLEFTNSTTGTNAVLQPINIGIEDGGIAPGKITPSSTSGDVLITNTSGVVEWVNQDQLVTPVVAEDLTTDGKIVVGNNESTITTKSGAVLQATTLSIKKGAIDTDELANAAVKANKIDNGAVTHEKLHGGSGAAGRIPVAAADGSVTYQSLNNLVERKDLTTDGKIVIGNNESTTTTQANAVLEPTTLSIKKASIGTEELAEGAVTATKLQAGAGDAGRVPIADAQGAVTYQQINLEDAGIEPWLNQDDDEKAKLNTDNVYLKGNVAIGRTAAFNEDAVLDVAATLTDGTNSELASVFSVLKTGDIQAKLLPHQPFDETKSRNVVVVDEDGNLRIMPGNAEFAIPRYFYMPSVIVPTHKDQIKDINEMNGLDNPSTNTDFYSHSGGTFTVNIYDMYNAQFKGTKSNSVSSNANATPANKPDLFTFAKNDLIYNITWWDARVFDTVVVDADGVLTYTIKTEGPVTFGSFMNIVLEVK